MGGISLEVTAVGAAVILLSALSVFAGRLAGAALLGATIPLSASAAMIFGWAGGATILCVVIAAAAVIARASLEGAAGALTGAALRPGAAGSGARRHQASQHEGDHFHVILPEPPRAKTWARRSTDISS